MARTAAIGKQDFGRLIEDNCFYIDKTNFIKEWWENKDDVTLITRPRRFGKTLTMSMVNYFFSIQHADRGDLFEGLSIWKEGQYRDMQGTYPVIFLSFANVKGDDFITVREDMCQLLAGIYADYEFLLDSGVLAEEDKKFFKRITSEMGDSDAALSLHRLSKYLYKYYGKRPIILLDEYDTPMHEAYVGGYWDKMVNFTRRLFNSTFKTNPYLERAIMTGITRISKESIFSDLSNPEVVSITSKKYESIFGFTEDETFKALEEFGLESKKADVKRWYDGFHFGECDSIYNPWSITNFLGKKKLLPYWANTSSNKLIGSLIQSGSFEIKAVVEELLQGKSFQTAIDEETIFSGLDSSEEAVWNLLLASGYLKIDGSAVSDQDRETAEPEYKLKLTNMEVIHTFKKIVRGWFGTCKTSYNTFMEALLDGDLEKMNIYMNKVSLHTFSCFDTGNKPSEATEPERFYHGFVLGLIAELQDRYEITSNRESGFGRYDVMLSPVNRTDDGIILEFKVIDPDVESSLQDTANAALRQIIDKNYAAMLESKGISTRNIRIYGLAFQGKKVFIDGGCRLPCV